MFEKDQPEDTSSQSQAAEIPPVRHFRVTRYRPGTIEIEVVDVFAHQAGISATNVACFDEFINDPAVGPRARIARRFRDWLEYEEATLPLSSLLVN